VVDEGELVGIVSETDLITLESLPDPRAHALRGPAPVAGVPHLVGEVMTREVLALPPDADAAEAARLMLDRGVKSVPVVLGRRVVGIVTRRDLLGVLARSDQAIRAEVARLLDEELGGGQRRVEVTDGVVILVGFDPGRDSELAALLARTVPGVVEVRVTAPQ
jgi:signal-transduction protein with cAMP-binding, CBS, and nucleotidyltransferase domain